MWAVTAVSLLAAALVEAARVPAGALLGGMLVAVAATLLFSVRVSFPRPLPVGAQAVLGAALCSAFQPSAWAALGEHWAVALTQVVGVVAVAQGVALVAGRLGGVDVRTATIGLMPGGAAAMVALSEEVGADARLVMLFQCVRLGVVILAAVLVGHFSGGPASPHLSAQTASETMPLLSWGTTALVALVGVWLGLRMRLPAGAFFGPVLVGAPLTALGVPVGAWPPGVLMLALWVLGVRVGGHFDAAAVHELRRVALTALLSAVGLVAGCALLAWAWSAASGVDLLTAYFATSPGGADSVLAIALGTGASLSLVLAVQVGRLLLIFLVAPALLRRTARRRQASSMRPSEDA